VRLAPLTTDAESILVLAGDYGSPKKLADWLKLAALEAESLLLLVGDLGF